ncbi:hypothetical protein [Flavobacterium sp.]|uniref:hypothetical protein n=1 Tax=Flavobacterium sp. TaxID=239 RepID=UPI00286C5506|nr:hypothetical protein [Flavobacterium sp.]
MKVFKKTKGIVMLSVVIFGISLFVLSCSKDSASYTCATCHDTPEALVANDGSAKGIYKGTEVGSSGTLSINIQNGSSTITGVMVLDGESVILTSSVAYVDGAAYVAPFTGVFDGSPISITFSVAIGGLTPLVTASNIPGHPDATFTLYKETSTSLIEVFEGTYTKTGGETGVFNILLSRALNKWGGVALNDEPGSEPDDDIDGTINASNQLIVTGNGVNIGTISGDEIHGSFVDGNSATINITGHRTL